MAIEVKCPGCEKRYRVPENLAGKRIRCKECQKAIAVPAELNEDDELEEPEPEPRPKKSKKVRVTPDEEDDRDDRPRKPKKGKRKKSKSGGIPVWVYLAGGGGLAAVIAVVVVVIVVMSGNRKTPADKNLPPIAGNPGGNNPVVKPAEGPVAGEDGPLQGAAIFSEVVNALDTVTTAVSQVNNRATLDAAISTIQGEKSKLELLKKRVETAPKIGKIDRDQDREFTNQIQARSKSFTAEVQKLQFRVGGTDIDLPSLRRFDTANREFGQEIISLGRAIQSKTG